MSQRFPNLFTPLEVGPITVKNRFLYPAHNTLFFKHDPTGDGRWTVMGDRAVHYYAERARGGWGLIAVGQTDAHGVRPWAGSHWPEAVGPYTRIADAVHEHGAKVVVQVTGGVKGSRSPDRREPSWNPSPLLGLVPGEMTKEMDEEDIRVYIEGFVLSARHIKAAGMDGIEVHLAHAHELQKFLLPAFNKRRDRYGGSLADRLRFPMDVIEAIRGEVGADFVLGVRTNAEFDAPGGQSREEGLEVARRLTEFGSVDYLSVSAARIYGSVGTEEGYNLPAPRPSRPPSQTESRSSPRTAFSLRRWPSGRWPKATATWWAWYGRASRTPSCPTRRGKAGLKRSEAASARDRDAWAVSARGSP